MKIKDLLFSKLKYDDQVYWEGHTWWLQTQPNLWKSGLSQANIPHLGVTSSVQSWIPMLQFFQGHLHIGVLLVQVYPASSFHTTDAAANVQVCAIQQLRGGGPGQCGWNGPFLIEVIGGLPFSLLRKNLWGTGRWLRKVSAAKAWGSEFNSWNPCLEKQASYSDPLQLPTVRHEDSAPLQLPTVSS